jgi:hypothetical protein
MISDTRMSSLFSCPTEIHVEILVSLVVDCFNTVVDDHDLVNEFEDTLTLFATLFTGDRDGENNPVDKIAGIALVFATIGTRTVPRRLPHGASVLALPPTIYPSPCRRGVSQRPGALCEGHQTGDGAQAVSIFGMAGGNSKRFHPTPTRGGVFYRFCNKFLGLRLQGVGTESDFETHSANSRIGFKLHDLENATLKLQRHLNSA